MFKSKAPVSELLVGICGERPASLFEGGGFFAVKTAKKSEGVLWK